MIVTAVEKPIFEDILKKLSPDYDGRSEASFNDVYSCKHLRNYDTNYANHILYAWGNDAGPLVLPSDTAFKVPKGYSIILEVHFLVPPPKEKSPGILVSTIPSVPAYLAGVYLMVIGNFQIPPHTGNYPVDIACQAPLDLSVFAARVHAHAWSKTATAYRENENSASLDMVIKGNPHWAQEFYTRHQGPIEIKTGDKLYGRCVFNNDLDQTITVGSGGKDEMCNFYLLYRDKAEKFAPVDMCFQHATNVLKYKLPKNSYDLPPYPGFSGERYDSKNLPVKVPEYIKQISMSLIDEVKMTDDFLSGLDINLVSSVALTPDSEFLFVFYRGERTWERNTFLDKPDGTRVWNGGDDIVDNTIILVDAKNGQEIYRFGAGMFRMPHGIYVDPWASYLWVTDVGYSNVRRLDLSKFWVRDGPTIRIRRDAGRQDHWETINDPNFCMPTDIAAASFNGQKMVFISDGYCNERVAQYDVEFLSHVRDYTVENSQSVLVAHSVAILGDSVCMADREHSRLICWNYFQPSLVPKIHNMGEMIGKRLFGICSVSEKLLVGINGPDNYGDGIKPLVFVMEVESGKVFKTWDALNLISPHLLTCSSDRLFVADMVQGVKFSIPDGVGNYSVNLSDFSITESVDDEGIPETYFNDEIIALPKNLLNYRGYDIYYTLPDNNSPTLISRTFFAFLFLFVIVFTYKRVTSKSDLLLKRHVVYRKVPDRESSF